MKSININLSVANKGFTQIVDYVQGSNMIPIVFEITDYDIPSGATANIYIKKPSGAQIYNSCTISENEVTVQPTTQMFAESGKQFGQLQILSGQKILESFLILFNVEKSIIDDAAIESSDEFTALEDALNSIDDVATEAENAVSAANQAVSDAQTAIKNANTAINGANAAASSANSAAESATNATSAANTATEGANTAAQNANEKASAANSAAEAANNAVDALEEALQGTVINDNSVSNLTTYSSQKIEGEFDDVNEVIYEIGGRNLIKYSEITPRTSGGTLSCDINSGLISGSNQSWYLIDNIYFEKNKTYVVSSKNITNESTAYPDRIRLAIAKNDLSTVLQSLGNLYGNDNIVFICNQETGTYPFLVYVSGEDPAPKFSIECLKLEVGSTPTRWTPAPEDIENKIDSKLSEDGDGASLTVDFTEAASVSNITSGSTLATLFGQILKNQNDFLDADTIQAAEDAGILSGGGLTLLNEILQLYLANAVVEKTTIDGWTVIKYTDGTCKGYKDVTASGTLSALGASGTLAAFGYMAINAESPPSGITAEFTDAVLAKSNGWGWLARMAGDISSAYRFLAFGGGGETRNLTIRWRFTGTY